MEEQTYCVYYLEREDHFVILTDEETNDGDKIVKEILVKGYCALTKSATSYDDAENFICEYLYKKISRFSIQRGY